MARADIYEDGTKATTFDGAWKKAKLTEDEYMKAFADADDEVHEDPVAADRAGEKEVGIWRVTTGRRRAEAHRR